MKKTSTYLDPEMKHLGYRGTENANVTIIARDKKCFQNRIDMARGHALNPITNEDLSKKFRICAEKAMSEKKSEKILSLLTSLEESTDIGELFV